MSDKLSRPIPDLTLLNRLVKEINDMQSSLSEQDNQDALVSSSKVIGLLTSLSREAGMLVSDYMRVVETVQKTVVPTQSNPLTDLLKVKN